jgi:hypothetical protein
MNPQFIHLKEFYSKERYNKRKMCQATVLDMLKSDGWKIVLEDYKRSLKEEYSGLMKIPFLRPLLYWKKKVYIKTLRDIIDRAYFLAGTKWTWNGYTEYEETFDPEDAEELEDHERMLNYITGEDLLGEGNG